MNRFLVVCSGILFSILFVGYFTNYSASAATDWDNVANTDNLVIWDTTRNEEYDVTETFRQLFEESTNATCDSAWESFQVAQEQGWYGYSKYTRYSSYTSSDIIQSNAVLHFNELGLGGPIFSEYPGFGKFLGTRNPTDPGQVGDWSVRISRINGVTNVSCTQGFNYGIVMATAGRFSNGEFNQVFFVTKPPVYPPEYEGIEIPTQNPGDIVFENLRPEYTYQVSPGGKLSINYTKNLKTFLTGTSFFVLEKMNENWEGVDENVYSNLAYTPAGSLTGDSKFAVLNEPENIDMVVPEKGYYMIRIDHNQQLDSPPWEEDAGDKYNIEQVYLQFYWDGSSVVVGDNIGGCDGICNPEKGTANNKILTALRKFNVDDHGLQAIIFIPLEFFATIPSITQTCTPLSIPFIDRNMSVPCIREPLNQAQPAMVFLITVFINGIVTLGVAFALFRHIKNLHDPKKDEIEVLKL